MVVRAVVKVEAWAAVKAEAVAVRVACLVKAAKEDRAVVLAEVAKVAAKKVVNPKARAVHPKISKMNFL